MGTIMVIDDKELSLDLIEIFLSHDGFKNVSKYSCPYKALEDIKKHLVPQIIITDFRMPELNGLQFILSAEKTAGHQIPAVILTGDEGSLPPIPSRITVIEKGQTMFFTQLMEIVHRVCDKPEIMPEQTTNYCLKKRNILKKRSRSSRHKLFQAA